MPHATSVSRVWGDNDKGELLAVFQYTRDAEAFATWRIADDAAANYSTSCFYVCACGLTGEIKVFRPAALYIHERPEGK